MKSARVTKITKENAEQLWAMLIEYCDGDVERAIKLYATHQINFYPGVYTEESLGEAIISDLVKDKLDRDTYYALLGYIDFEYAADDALEQGKFVTGGFVEVEE